MHHRLLWILCHFIALQTAYAGPPFPELVDPHPNAGNQFGYTVQALSTGNVVVSAPFDDAGGTNAGAVYLFNGATGALISTLTGSTANDNIGTNITVLSNGNFLVISPSWDGTAGNVGAVTWCSGVTGRSGVVSASNSLVGSKANDNVGGGGVTEVGGGNYVVQSPNWDGAASDSGAVTWGNGASGVSGAVSSSNSLVGSRVGDQVGGSFGVTVLTNGNYVVRSIFWDGAASDVGAVTFGLGNTGITGVVSAANSLVGTTANDQVGLQYPTALSNGNYVVCSSNWDNGALANVGAATFCNGTTGRTGTVTSANSLVGNVVNDQVAYFGATALSNGNYVVVSPLWNDGAATQVGAVTWASGTDGLVGSVSSANSLVGGTAGDSVGNSNVVALTNGNYVVLNRLWDNGGLVDVGSATWGNGTTGISGVVSAANSLHGSQAGDGVGNEGIALPNGNYVLRAPQWSNGTTGSVGAVTWGNGATGISGPVTAANSLVGAAAGDQIGNRGLVSLTNGNYVVRSQRWGNTLGAVTLGNGSTGTFGTVTAANSLVGSAIGDNVGSGQVTPLANGNYVVASTSWANGSINRAGAVTLCSGTTSMTGVITPANSLVGSKANDEIGSYGIVAFSNGNYAVVSGDWDNGALADAGAVTFGNGSTGVAGVIDATNSSCGLAAGTGIFDAVRDDVNGTFLCPFYLEGGGRVRLGSQLDGFAPTVPGADLSSLVLGNGTLSPFFTAGVTTYSATVGSAVSSLTLTPTAAASGATIQVQVNSGGFAPVASGSAYGGLALQMGSNSVEVKVTASGGSPTKTYTTNVTRLRVVEEWRQTYFGGISDSGTYANDADHDNDGIKNLLEFAFDTNPASSGSGNAALTYASGVLSAAGQPLLQLTPTRNVLFVRRTDYLLAGISYSPEFSNDLITWFPSTDSPTVLATAGLSQAVNVPFPVLLTNGKEAKFIRMKVMIAP